MSMSRVSRMLVGAVIGAVAGTVVYIVRNRAGTAKRQVTPWPGSSPAG
jgi:hypothetical protein